MHGFGVKFSHSIHNKQKGVQISISAEQGMNRTKWSSLKVFSLAHIKAFYISRKTPLLSLNL
jgi:hypothetical protein